MQILKLKENISIAQLKKRPTKEYLYWSNNKYCSNKKVSKVEENHFFDFAQKFLEITSVKRETSGGAYLEIKYLDSENTICFVILYLSKYYFTRRIENEYLNFEVPQQIVYENNNENFSISDFIELSKLALFKKEDCLNKYLELLASARNIEMWIPNVSGEFKSGGPRRVVLFFLNYILEKAVVEASRIGRLSGLNINGPLFIKKNESGEDTHKAFHPGAGDTLADLEDSFGVSYEIKGPCVNINKILETKKKNKSADYILHLDSDDNLNLYKLESDNYIFRSSVKFPFRYLEKSYIEFLNLFESSWEETWYYKYIV